MNRRYLSRLLATLLVSSASLLALPASAADEAADALINRLSTDVMDSINLSHAPLQAPTLIAQAAQLAQSGKYLEASSKLAAARAELDAVQLQQAQALRVELQKRIDNMLAELEPFRDASVPSEIAYQRTVVYNHIASAQDHLDSSDYAGAATMIGAAGNDTQDLIVRLDAWANGQNTTARPAQAMDAQLKAKAANLSAQWAVLNLQAQILGDYNTSQSLKTLIDSGASLADVGAYMDANRTLTDAENRLAQWQSSLEQMNVTAQMAQNASLVIGNASQMVSQNIAAWQAAGLNTQAISDKLAQAQALVGSQPEQARTLALQVIEMAKMENDKMASSSSVYGWLGLAIGAVAVVGIGVWMLVKSRSGKKKGWGG